MSALPQSFQAFVIRQDENRKVCSGMEALTFEQLDAGEVLIRVSHSSINYKDALAATGAGKIIRRFPCIGGIDMAGIVLKFGKDPQNQHFAREIIDMQTREIAEMRAWLRQRGIAE